MYNWTSEDSDFEDEDDTELVQTIGDTDYDDDHSDGDNTNGVHHTYDNDSDSGDNLEDRPDGGEEEGLGDNDADGEVDNGDHSDGEEEVDDEDDDDLAELNDGDESYSMGHHIDVEYDVDDDESLDVVIRIGGERPEVRGDDSHYDDGDNSIHQDNSEYDNEEDHEVNEQDQGEEEMNEEYYDDGEEGEGEEDEEEFSRQEEGTSQNNSLRVIIDNKFVMMLAEYERHHRNRIDSVYPVLNSMNSHLFEDCSICFNQLYKKHLSSCYLECLHWYHFKCIKSWSENKRLCPVCRGDFSNLLTLSE